MKKLLLIALLVVGCEEDNALEQVLAEVEDCAGVAGGEAVEDDCGVCNGDNSTCIVCIDCGDSKCCDCDGNVYATAQIGNQYWMIENLMAIHYNNGDEIKRKHGNSHSNLGLDGGYYTYMNGDSINNFAAHPNILFSDVYGYLYDWNAVIDDRGICPEGWHIPSYEEWNVLINNFNSNQLRTTGTQYWGSYFYFIEGLEFLNLLNADATNESGFSALPAGRLDTIMHPAFSGLGAAAHFFSAADLSNNQNYPDYVTIDITGVEFWTLYPNREALSVRCLKD